MEQANVFIQTSFAHVQNDTRFIKECVRTSETMPPREGILIPTHDMRGIFFDLDARPDALQHACSNRAVIDVEHLRFLHWHACGT